jgi:RNA polymerase sigma factor (sigma-70 family)
MPIDLEAIFLAGIEQNKDRLFRICSVYTHDAEEASDLFQDVLANIWQAMPTFSAKSSISTWMFRITLNICLRLRSTQTRRRDIFVNINKENLENIGSSSEQDEPTWLLALLRSCIKDLNDAEKSIITLYLEELPYKEIAEITGLTENTIAVKVKRIKNKLLNCMSESL